MSHFCCYVEKSIYNKKLHISGSKISPSSQHHDRDILTPDCGVDIDYQTSTTAYNVHWNISKTAQNFVTHVQWALQRREAAGSSNARWVMVREFENVGKSSHALAANLHMTEGQLYRALVKPCHSSGCFQVRLYLIFIIIYK